MKKKKLLLWSVTSIIILPIIVVGLLLLYPEEDFFFYWLGKMGRYDKVKEKIALSSWGHRTKAVSALSRLRDERAHKLLKELALDKHDCVKFTLISYLDEIPLKEAMGISLILLNDDNQKVVYFTEETLGKIEVDPKGWTRNRSF